MLLDPSEIIPKDAKVTYQGKYEGQDENVNDEVSNEKDEKCNTYPSSNSISPQSTVTQLTDTPLNGKLFV